MTKTLTIRINKSAIFAFLVITFFLQPSNFFSVVPSYFAPLLRVGQILILFYLITKSINRKDIFKPQLMLIMAYYLLIYGVSLIIKSSTPQLMEAFASIGICMYISYAYLYEQDNMFTGFATFYLLYAIAEVLIIIILRPDPLKYDLGLFYNRNHLVRFFLPGIFFILMKCKNKTQKYITIYSLAYLGMMSFIILYGKSATGLVALVVLLALLLVFRNKPIPKYLEIKYMVIYTILLFVGIFVFHIEKHFDYIITVLLQRDMTFSGRLYIWIAALDVIKENLLLGIGAYSNYGSFLLGFKHAHQYWLQSLLSGGIIGTIILLIIYINASNSLRDSKQVEGSNILCIVIDIILIIGIDEALTKTEMLIPLLLIAGLYGLSTKTSVKPVYDVKNHSKEYLITH